LQIRDTGRRIGFREDWVESGVIYFLW
jgi:hypothetical protein